MQWFRWYHETSADPKFGSISRKLGVPKYLVLAVWQVVLESASANHASRGKHDIDPEGMADRIGSETKQAADVLAAFIERGMVNSDGTVTAFERRQTKSDTSATRVKQHRERKKQSRNDDVTVAKRPTPEMLRPVDTDTDSVPSGTAGGAPARTMTVYDTGEALLTLDGTKPASARALIAKLCKANGDAAVASAIEQLRSRDPPPADMKSALVFAVTNGKINGKRQSSEPDIASRLHDFLAGDMGGSRPAPEGFDD